MAAGIMDFVQRYNSIQQQRDTSDGLIKDLLIYCERVENALRIENSRLSKELEDAQLDLDDARKSRRDLQQQLTAAFQRVSQSDADCALMRTRNPYIQVLIDGDGIIFNKEYIQQGIEGGKQAAVALRNIILEHCSELTDEIEIMAKVCTNISGLAKALVRDGSIDSVEAFRDFTIGFTQGKVSFEYVDVGHGKERADSKIKEIMRWHLRNHNCQQILLGISHDAGYAPFLDEVVTLDDRRRITIIEGPPTVREITATGLQILNFNQLFRSEKLVDKGHPHTASATSPSTWAGVTSIPPPLQTSPVINGVSIKRSSPAPIPTWIPYPRGLDESIAVNALVLDKIKRRTNNNKLCNNHYLRGPCAKGNECCFEHEYKPSEEELKAIAFLTRLNPCLNGQDCESEFCIYGHHCPSTMYSKKDNEWQCCAFGCRFAPEDHPPNTMIKHPRKETQRIEYYERY